MPVRDLIRAFSIEVPTEVREVSEGLMYRDFITVGLLASKLAVSEKDGTLLKDNWIYIQEPDVLVGRLQIFNNWSPWLVEQQRQSLDRPRILLQRHRPAVEAFRRGDGQVRHL